MMQEQTKGNIKLQDENEVCVVLWRKQPTMLQTFSANH